MTPDPIRALLAELADELDHSRQCLMDDRRLTHPLADRARAALAAAPADGPAVPSEGREPAAVAGEPSDQDLYDYWISTSPELGCADPVGFARAVLARWGRPTTPPAPAAGDVGEALAARPLLEQVAAIGDCISEQTVGRVRVLAGRASAWLAWNPPGQPVAIEPRGCLMPGACSCVELPTPQPVPVSERLPGAEDCDAEGRCWFFDPCDHGWWWLRSALFIDGDPDPLTHWLPAHALPLPTTTPAGQEGE